jgi:chemotaxis protein MotB
MSSKKFRIRKIIKWNFGHYNTDEGGDDNWLVSYADLMTLLFGFFVILTVFSTPSSEKMEKLTQATANAMGSKYVSPFNQLSNQIQSVLNNQSIKNVVGIENLTEGLILTTSSTNFFASSSDELLPEAEKLLTDIGKILQENAAGFNLIIEGHTDDVPINTKQFPSNWELSLHRASKVVRLFEQLGIPHSSLRPVGLSDLEPIVPINNLSAQALVDAREKNRRVVIRVIQNLPK